MPPADELNSMLAFLTDTQPNQQVNSAVSSRAPSRSTSRLDLTRPESDLGMHAILEYKDSDASCPSDTRAPSSASSTPATTPLNGTFGRSSSARSSRSSGGSRPLPPLQPPPKSLPPLQPPPKSPPPRGPPPRGPPPTHRTTKRGSTSRSAPSFTETRSATSTGIVLDDDTTVLDHDDSPIYFRSSPARETIDRNWLVRGSDEGSIVTPVVAISPVVGSSGAMARSASTSRCSGGVRVTEPCPSSYSPPPHTPYTPRQDGTSARPPIKRSPSTPSTLDSLTAPSITSPSMSSFHSSAYSLQTYSDTSTRIAPVEKADATPPIYDQLTWSFAAPKAPEPTSKRRFGRRTESKTEDDKEKEKEKDKDRDDASYFGVSRARVLMRRILH